MTFVTGVDFGRKLCKKMGIDSKNITRIIIDIRLDAFVDATITRILTDDETTHLLDMVKGSEEKEKL